MESIKKVKIFIYLVFFAAIILFAACSGKPPIIQDPLVLMEVAPLPRQVVAQEPTPEYEPVYTIYRIIEVSEVGGVQRNFLVRFGADKTGVSVGVTGDIAEDSGFQKIIGNYRVTEVYTDFFRCNIQELSYRIGSTAFIRVQTGEKIKGSS
jgi:hypothetical protein